MKYSKRNAGKGKATIQDYWQSYSDMMAALLLLFILIMAGILLRSMVTFDNMKAELEEFQQEVELQLAQNEEQAAALKKQEETLEETKAQLRELERIAGLKSSIIEDLSKEFEKQNVKVTVDDKTGDIVFDSSILFAFGSDKLTNEGTAFLKQFLPVYLSVLLGDKYRDSIAEIVIEGHTDDVNTYIYNLGLSQNRALSVASFCMDTGTGAVSKEDAKILEGLIAANGKSFSNLVYKDGKVDQDASRRVVFKFRIKDEEMIDEIKKILGDFDG